MTNLTSASARGVAWNLAQNLAGRLLGLGVVAVLARHLDRADFGAIAIALTVTTFAELVALQGFGDFIAQRSDLQDAHKDTAFWFNIASGLLLTGLIVVLAEPIAAEFDRPSLAPIIRWLSISVALRSISAVPVGLLVRELRFRTLSLRSLLALAIGGVAGLVAAILNAGVYSLVLQTLVVEVVSVVTLWSATTWRPRLRFSGARLVEIFAFGGPIIAAHMLNFISRRLDNVIVSAALGLATLGGYSMAQRIFQIANQILNKSNDAVAFSALSRVGAGDRQREAFSKVVEAVAALTFPLYAGLAVLATPTVVVVFGARWSDVGPTLTVFATAGIPLSLTYLHWAAFKATARTRLYFVGNLVSAAIYLPLMLVLVQSGPTYAAVAYLVACIISVPVELALVRLALGTTVVEYMGALRGAALSTAVMVAAMYGMTVVLVDQNPILLLTVTSLIGAVVYALALRFLARGTFERFKQLVRSALLKRRSTSAS